MRKSSIALKLSKISISIYSTEAISLRAKDTFSELWRACLTSDFLNGVGSLGFQEYTYSLLSWDLIFVP